MSLEEIYQEMARTFQRETGTALAGDGDMAVRLYAVAAQVYSLYVQADWVGGSAFPRQRRGSFWTATPSCGGWSGGKPWPHGEYCVSSGKAVPKPT